MQTFDALLPSAHAPSARNTDNNFTPEKSADSGEKFGDVMRRALTSKPREVEAEDNKAQPNEKPGTQEAASSSSSTDTKHTVKPSKPHRREATKVDASASSINAVAAGTTPLSQLVLQTDSDDDGTSHDASIGTEKSKHASAAGNADDASKLISAQFLAFSGLPQPVAPVAPSATGTQVSKSGKRTSDLVSNTLAKAGPANTSQILPEDLDSDVEPVQPDPDPKQVETKNFETHSETPPVKEGITAPQSSGTETTEAHIELADAINAISTHMDDAKGMQATAPKTSADKLSAIPPGLRGTSAAKHYVTMKKAEKTPKVAGLAEQDLPSSPATGSDELPAGQILSAKASSHGSEKVDATASIDSHGAVKISASSEPQTLALTAEAVAPTSNVDGRLRVLERTHDIVALHAMRLSQTGSDSLHVVVKPGGGIQLSLELRKSESGIEVHASLHKGDLEHLSQYWPELQQRLETRGVRVGALTTSENFSSTGQQQFQQSKQQQSSQQDPLYAGAFAEFALAGAMSEAPAIRVARATAYRGWETWA